MRRQFLLLLTGALAVVLSNLRRFNLRRLSSRKVLVGACATMVAASAALVPYALATPTATTTPSADETAALQTDDLPNAMEQARRAAREKAIAGVLTGKYTAVKRGASTVVDLGPDARSTLDSVGRRQRQERQEGRRRWASRRQLQVAVRRDCPGEDRPDLRDPGRVRQPDKSVSAGPGRPAHRRVRCTTRSPRPTGRSTTRRSGARTSRSPTSRTCTSAAASH